MRWAGAASDAGLLEDFGVRRGDGQSHLVIDRVVRSTPHDAERLHWMIGSRPLGGARHRRAASNHRLGRPVRLARRRADIVPGSP
jgi:hypothetical protein